MSGSYKLQVMATQSGGYVMNITIRDANGKRWHEFESNLNLKRIVSSGTVHTYDVSFDHDDINNLHVTKELTSGDLKTSIQTASDLNWIDNKGILNSLMKKVEHNQFNAFINEVEAQRGKYIKKEAADILINDAQTLINQIK
jgi:hypothetical protein